MEVEFNDYIFDFEIFKHRMNDLTQAAKGVGYAIFSQQSVKLYSKMDLLSFLRLIRQNAVEDCLKDGIIDLITVGSLVKKDSIKQKT